MLDFGREICSDLSVARRREWLVTNGMGAYAAGTVAGMLTRRYHGLLVAALQPPLGRTLLLAKLDESICCGGQTYALFANDWAGGQIEADGLEYMERFRLEGTVPLWSFACGAALLEKRVWMQQGANTTYVRYDLVRAPEPVRLEIKALVNYRDYHGNTRADDWQMDVELVPDGLQVTAFAGAVPFYLLSPGAQVAACHEWYRDYDLEVEEYRGLDSVEDHLCVGHWHALLQPGESLTLVASTEAEVDLDGVAALARQRTREEWLLEQSGATDAVSQRLVLAADAFVVRRNAPDGSAGYTIMAGYPWFGDWGRDTMISLPGLTLATGRSDIAASILRTFAHFVDQGMLPNRFPDGGETPDYNTVDATLWYFEAVRAYFAASGDEELLRELFPVLEDIVDWHLRGTRYAIQVDAADGLLAAGALGSQLTWMDAKVGDWVVTPRAGKAVEINALWYNALCSMAEFARQLGKTADAYQGAARRTQAGFARFWNEAAGYCYDVIDGPDGCEAGLRPNQLLAVSLAHSPLAPQRQRAVVDACARHLLTSHGMRSLGPGEPDYGGAYGGDQYRRDAVYHQGTVWGWLIGPFVSAHLRVYADRVQARSFLQPLIQHLAAASIGSISEIFDGDPPFAPRGCTAQAWSVAEVLRTWQETLD